MKTDAYLVSKKIYNELGSLERIDWSWDGGQVAFLGDHLIWHLEDIRATQINGKVVTIGPFRLRVIAREQNAPYGIYVMRDGFRARIRQCLYPLVATVNLIYRRLIITAGVWGLADINVGLIPTWKDVYLLRRIADRVKKGVECETELA